MSAGEGAPLSVPLWYAFERIGSFESLASDCPHCGGQSRWQRQNVVVVAGALVPAIGSRPVVMGTLEIALCSACRGMAIGLSGSAEGEGGRPLRVNAILFPPPQAPDRSAPMSAS